MWQRKLNGVLGAPLEKFSPVENREINIEERKGLDLWRLSQATEPKASTYLKAAFLAASASRCTHLHCSVVRAVSPTDALPRPLCLNVAPP